MLEDVSLLRNLGVLLLTAIALLILVRRIAIPNIVVYIVSGLLLGPVLGLVTPGDGEGSGGALPVLTHVGIALLLFLVGLELSFDRIRDVGKVAVVAGVGQILFTAFFGFLFALPLGFTITESVFIAVALTFSSTVVVVKLLRQKNELMTLYGRISVGIFLVQDLAVVVALTLLAGIGGGTDGSAVGAVAMDFAKAVFGMLILAAVALLSLRFFLGRVFDWAARSGDVLSIWGLTWCFLFVLGAELLGLSLEMGAFLAGVGLAQHPASGELRRRLGPLMNFFVALFFLSLGAEMDLSGATRHWAAGVLLSLFVLIGNPLIFILIVGRFGYSERTTFLTSVTVAQISEFSLILGALAVAKGIIDPSILSLVTVIALLTIIGSAYMILFNDQLYRWCRDRGLLRIFRLHGTDRESLESEHSGHVIVVGMNPLGRRLVGDLLARGCHVLAIDTDPEKLSGLACRTLHGDVEHVEVMEEAEFERARLVISALQIEEVNMLLAWRCRRLGIPVAIHAFDGSVVRDLEKLGVEHLIDSKMVGNVRLVTVLAERGLVDV